MKNLSLIFSVLILITSCKKEADPENYHAEVKDILALTDSSATVEMTYFYPKKVYDAGVNISFGLNPNGDNPYLYDHFALVPSEYEGEFLLPTEVDNLFADTDYYFQAEIKSTNNDIHVISEVFTLTTKTLPPPNCIVPDNIMDIDEYVETMSPLVQINSTEYAIYESTCSIGNLEFTFEEEPKSGIYKATDDESDFNFSDEKLVLIGGYFDILWNCYHSADNYERVHVENDNGNISITLCDVNFTPHGGTCTTNRPLTGNVRM